MVATVNLYQQLADKLMAQMDRGLIQPGERLPGVRTMSQRENVSAATVISAYRSLELTGHVFARERSGFFVATRPKILIPEPEKSRPASKPRLVKGQDATMQLLRNSRDKSLIPLGAAIPSKDILPLRGLNQVTNALSQRQSVFQLNYETPGVIELRREIAKRMIQLGCDTDADDVVITSGCQEAVYLTLKVLTKPGDIVALESPTYYGLLQAVESLGLKAIEIATHPRTGIDLQELEQASQRWPIKACILVANFSNPMGACLSDSDKATLVKLADKHDFFIVEDDVYGDMSFEHRRPIPIKSFDSNERVIHCSSKSKTISPGLRVGWAISKRFSDTITYQKYLLNGCAAPFMQLVLYKFLSSGKYDRGLRDLQNQLAQNVTAILGAIGRHFPSEIKVTRPQGGCVLWLEGPRHLNSECLAAEAVREGVTFAPGSVFSTTDKYSHCFRLSFGLRWNKEVDAALRKLGLLLKFHVNGNIKHGG